MQNPTNVFKATLKERRHQLGIWNTIGGNTVPDMLGGAGFDWVLIDCEHAAIEAVEVLPALQAIAAHPNVSAIVRPAANDPTLFKRLLDMGAQTLLVPYVQTVEEAEQAVAAMRYGPHGVRGMAGMTRATRYGQVDDYFATACA
jgi:4-hydroxy-2-oxoheptanedioate aldolase